MESSSWSTFVVYILYYIMIMYILGVVFNASTWVSREEPLALSHQSFESLDVFSLCLVVEDVGDILSENLLSTRTGVDSDHGYADGPWRVPDGHLKVGVTRLRIRNSFNYSRIHHNHHCDSTAM